MLNVNDEARDILAKLGVSVVLVRPKCFTELPAVSLYTEKAESGFCCDNAELIRNYTLVTDFWAEDPEVCVSLAQSGEELMKGKGYYTVSVRDVPPESDGIYHRRIEFIRQYVLQEEDE